MPSQAPLNHGIYLALYQKSEAVREYKVQRIFNKYGVIFIGLHTDFAL